MSSESYFNVFENFVLTSVPLWHNCEKLRHVHNGTTQHFALPVRGKLNNQFTGRRIGRRGTTERPVHDLCWAQEEFTNKNREHSMNCILIHVSSNGMQQYAGVYLLQNYPTCFRCLSHPSSGIHKNVTAASGTGHSVRATTFRQRGL